MENYDFSDASIDTGSKYLDPGVHAVTISEVKNDLSSQKKTPYIEFSIQDKSGLSANHQYYLTTSAGPSGKSAFDISKNAILQLVMAGMNIDSDTAKTHLVGLATPEAMAQKLSSLLVGKQIAIHLSGKWINPSDTTKKPWLKAEFAGYKFVVPLAQIDELSHNPEKHIKGAPIAAETAGAVADAPAW